MLIVLYVVPDCKALRAELNMIQCDIMDLLGPFAKICYSSDYVSLLCCFKLLLLYTQSYLHFNFTGSVEEWVLGGRVEETKDLRGIPG